VVKPGETIRPMDKTVKMHVTVPAWLRAELEARAAKESRNLSNMVTLLLKQGVKKEKTV